jgi:hypothetical protein
LSPLAAPEYVNQLRPDDLVDDEVEVMNSHAHHGAPYDYSRDEIEQLARDFDTRIFQPPAVEDHDWLHDREPYDPQRTGANIGRPDQVRTVVTPDGHAHLIAHIPDLTPEAREKLKTGRYCYVSPEIYRNFRPTGRSYLRAVVFMGAHPPVGKNLLPPATKLGRPILFGEGTHGEVLRVPLEDAAVRLGEEGGGSTMLRIRPALDKAPQGGGGAAIGDPPAVRAPGSSDPPTNPLGPNSQPNPEWQNRGPGAPANPGAPGPSQNPPANPGAPPGPPPNPSPRPTIQMGEIVEAVQAAVAPLQRELADLRGQLTARDPDVGNSAILRFGDSLVSDRKIPPSHKEHFVALAKHLRGQTVRLGDQERDGLDVLRELEAAHGDVPPTGEMSEATLDGNAAMRFGDDIDPGFKRPFLITPETTDKEKKIAKDVAKWVVKSGQKGSFDNFPAALRAYEKEQAQRGLLVG